MLTIFVARKSSVLSALEGLWKPSESRFHCRGCGHIFCLSCQREMPLPKVGYMLPVPVCITCARIEADRKMFVTKKLSKMLKGQVMRDSVLSELQMVQLQYDDRKVTFVRCAHHEPLKTPPRSKTGRKLLPPRNEVYLKDLVKVCAQAEGESGTPLKYFLLLQSEHHTWRFECLEESIIKAWEDGLLQCKNFLK